MKIYTRDEKGQKIEVEYSQRVVEEDTYEAPIKINSYQDFRNCIIKNNEQGEYTSECRTKKYEKALARLLRDDNAKYMEYREQLENEYRENYRSRYGR